MAILTILFRREEATRTPDPHVPNVVRYQLRYFSLAFGTLGRGPNHRFVNVLEASALQSKYRYTSISIECFFISSDEKAGAKVLLFFDIRKKK